MREPSRVGYHQVGDYELSNLILSFEKESEIGVWRQRYKRHLKSNHRVLYYNYLTSGKLYEHISEVDIRAEKCFRKL